MFELIFKHLFSYLWALFSSTLMNQATSQFIVENSEKDVRQLALQAERYPLVDMPLAIRQISGRQKIRTKLPSFYANESIQYPAQLSLEQSSSESTALYKSSLCEGKELVDLTGGFGIDCFFMSAHFEQVTYVERHVELCTIAQHNFELLGTKHITVINAESEKYLDEINTADWIYIDPARRSTAGKKVVLISDCEPNVAQLSTTLLAKAPNVMIKLSPMMDVSAAITELPRTCEVHIIAVENECKEILLLLKSESSEPLKIKTINFGKKNSVQTFEFLPDDEQLAYSTFSPEIGKYLYEPNAAIMKSGAFKVIGNKFKLDKLHINTHLYTSNELEIDFPGRIFEVQKVWENGKNEWKNEAKLLKKANLTTRNYPSSVDELRKRLKLADGGNTYLFACTIGKDDKTMIACEKVEQ